MIISEINKMTTDSPVLTLIAGGFSSKPSTSLKTGKLIGHQEGMWKLEAHTLNTLKPNKRLMTTTMNVLISLLSTKESNQSISRSKELLKRVTRANLSLAQLKERIL